MNAFTIAARLAAVKQTLLEKLPESSYLDLEVKLNFSDMSPVRVTSYWSDRRSIKGWPADETARDEAHLEELLLAWEAFARNLPTREMNEKIVAVDGLGKAIDTARSAGLEVDAVSDAFRVIHENLLEAPKDDDVPF